MQRVTFQNRGVEVVGHLHLPSDFDSSGTYAAIVLATPGSSVKEQIGGIYASRLAERGFLALTFDPSYQGESGGEPRDLEDPAVRIEDLRCALDYLVTLPFVVEDRIGLLGICAGGGYAVQAALTDRRFRALGTVVASDIGGAFRRMGLASQLEEAGRQRTREARGGAARRDPWIPDSLEEAEGIEDPEVLEAVSFYRESPYRHFRSTNRLLFTSYLQLIGFDALHLVPELLVLPLLVIVGGRRGNTGQFELGQRLFQSAPSADKHWFVVEDTGHYELYHVAEAVAAAVDRSVSFFNEQLAP